MFIDEDLTGEIEALFSEQQMMHERAVIHHTLCGDGGSRHLTGVTRRPRDSAVARNGFSIFEPNPPKSDARKKYMADYARQVYKKEIGERLLAGERPKSGKGKRGPAPKVWLEVAKELGITL